MYFIALMLPLIALYLALTANLQFSNLVVGTLIAAGVLALLRPRPVPVNIRNTPGRLWAWLRYIVILVKDIIQSGLTTARLVLDPQLPIRPGIIAIPAQGESELGRALHMHALSVTPGEIVIEASNEDMLYTHCLDATHGPEYIVESQRLRTELLSQICD